jgi:Concanavalin A-like lectin/glucanases superfamily
LITLTADPNSDLYPQLQPVIDAAPIGAKIYIPGNVLPLRTRRPIRIYKPLTLCGDGPGATVIENGIGLGPCSVCAPPVSQIGAPPFGTDVNGNYFPFDGTNTYAYDVGADYGLSIDGWSQFCVECWVMPTPHIPGGPNWIISSMGRRLSTDSITTTFSLGTAGLTGGGGIALASLNVNGTLHSLAGGSLSVGTITHLALTYDGAVIRLFVNGALVASTPASGPITQSFYEDTIIGPSSQDYPYATLLNACFVGNLYSIRVGNSARYSSAFTPPGIVLSGDGTTKFALNANPPTDMFVQTYDHSWLPITWLNKSTVAGTGNIKIQDIGFGSGVLWHYTEQSSVDRVEFNGGDGYGWDCRNNCFNNSARDIQFKGNARVNWLARIAAGPWNLEGRTFIEGGKILLAMANGSVSSGDFELVPVSQTIESALIKRASGDASFNARVSIDAESGEGALTFDDMHQVILEGQPQSLTKPPVTINAGGGSILIGCDFNSSAPVMIHVPKKPVNPIKILGGNIPTGSAWADDMTAVEVI